jgi:hypothetical protein
MTAVNDNIVVFDALNIVGGIMEDFSDIIPRGNNVK